MTAPSLASAYQPFTFFSKADEAKSRGVVGVPFRKGHLPPTQSVPDRWVRPGSLPVRPGSVFVVVAEYDIAPDFGQGKNFSFGWKAMQPLPIDPLTGYQIQPVFAAKRPVDPPQGTSPKVILFDNKSKVAGSDKKHYAWFEVPANVPDGTTFDLWLADPSGDSIDGLPVTLEGPRLSIVVSNNAQAEASGAAEPMSGAGSDESSTAAQQVQQQPAGAPAGPSSLPSAPRPTLGPRNPSDPGGDPGTLPGPPVPPVPVNPNIPPTQSVPDRVAPAASSIIVSGQDMELMYNTKCYSMPVPPCDPAAVKLWWAASSTTSLPCNSAGLVYAAKGTDTKFFRIPTTIPVSAETIVKVDLYWMGRVNGEDVQVKAARPAVFRVRPKSNDAMLPGPNASAASAAGAASAASRREQE